MDSRTAGPRTKPDLRERDPDEPRSIALHLGHATDSSSWSPASGYRRASVTPAALAASLEPPRKVDFNFQVRPILSDKCFKCHGPDARNRKAGLRLDTKEGAFGETESGARAIVPGNLEDSELVPADHRRGRGRADAAQVAGPDALRRRRSTSSSAGSSRGPSGKRTGRSCRRSRRRPPRSRTPAWPRNPIDRFVLARLEAERLAPAPEADKERLIRRVTFDLTGLPPTLAEIDAFLADRSPGRLRAAGRPPAGLAAVRRADGRRLARPGPLRRHLRLPGRRLSRHVALARLGRPGLQRQPALRPVHHLATGRRPAAARRPATRSSPRRSTATIARPTRGAASRKSSASSTSPTGPTPSRPRSWG